MSSKIEKSLVKELIVGGTVGFLERTNVLPEMFDNQLYMSSYIEVEEGTVKMFTDCDAPLVFSDKIAQKILEQYPELEEELITVSQMRKSRHDTLMLISSGGLIIDKNSYVAVLIKDPGAPAGAAGCATNSMGRNEKYSVQENALKELQEEMTVIGIPSDQGIQRVVRLKDLDFEFFNENSFNIEHYYADKGITFGSEADDGNLYDPGDPVESFRAFVLIDESNNTVEIAKVAYFDGIITQVFDNEPFGRIGYPAHLSTLQMMKTVPVLGAAVDYLIDVLKK